MITRISTIVAVLLLAACDQSNQANRSAGANCGSGSRPSDAAISTAIQAGVQKNVTANTFTSAGSDMRSINDGFRINVIAVAADCRPDGSRKVTYKIVTNAGAEMDDSTELFRADSGKWYVEGTSEVKP